MSDEDKSEIPEQDNTWKNNQELNFKKVTPALHEILSGVQKLLEAQKAELAEMVKVKSRLKK